MRRRTIHLAFAAAALVSGALAAGEALQLRKAMRINQAAASADADSAASGVREARLAQANALSRAGRHDAALAAYNSLIQRDRLDAVGQAALFNLGNMLLRQGCETSTRDAFQAQALVELAKARYRDLLRANPGDWDARYNLERALWLAPEVQDMFGAETDDMPKERLRIKVPGLPPGDLP